MTLSEYFLSAPEVQEQIRAREIEILKNELVVMKAEMERKQIIIDRLEGKEVSDQPNVE